MSIHAVGILPIVRAFCQPNENLFQAARRMLIDEALRESQNRIEAARALGLTRNALNTMIARNDQRLKKRAKQAKRGA